MNTWAIHLTVFVAPVIPGLTEHEIPGILKSARSAGATFARYQLLRLPRSVKDLFTYWLEKQIPERKKRVVARIRDTRDGDLNDSRFYRRMTGEGKYATLIKDLFNTSATRCGLQKATESL
jgi:DNA repair photolyase